MGGGRGGGESRRCDLKCVLKGAMEMVEWRECKRLFQNEGALERNTLAPVMILTLGTSTHFLCLITVKGMIVMQQAWSESKQGAFREWFCRRTN